jgi:ABC transporter substrate binding protein (PQQ-dependent alcohol dehydrogenase system)
LNVRTAFDSIWTPRAAAVLAALCLLANPCAAQTQPPAAGPGAGEVHIGYLGVVVKRPPPEPYLDAIPADAGVAGARLGVDDDNTTGRFTGQKFVLEESEVPDGGDVVAAFKKLAADGIKLIATNLPEAALLQVADLPEAHDVTFLNAAAPDDDLRADKCRANVLDTVPSRAMLADALVQYLLTKRWPNVFLVVGPTDADRAYAAAMKTSITKFHAKLVAEKAWDYQPGSKRADTGQYAMTQQVANFTQGVDFDVLVVADLDDAFGDYLSYATYTPRPIAGTHGLIPSAWARPHQGWGATQLQDRFLRLAKRWMLDSDYAAWLAVRAVGEAATRTQSTDAGKIMDYMRSDKFELGGYKGVPLSFRPWDGQMRQAILLSDSRAVISVSPQAAFLHQFSQLDTLGVDRPETKCHMK